MIAGQQQTLGIPNEEGATITLRSLGHRLLRNAQDARRKKAAADFEGIDVSKFAEVLKEGNIDLDKELGEAVGDARNYAYDQDMVLEAGIVAWTYEQPVTPETIGDLDEDTAEWAFKQIIDMSRRTTAERKD